MSTKPESLESELPVIDEEAFEKGKQFLDGLRNGLQGFDGYPGIAYPGSGFPHAEELSVKIKPHPSERLFFKIGNGVLTSVEVEQFKVDGQRNYRREENIWGLGITEGRKAVVNYKPASKWGQEHIHLYGLFETFNPPIGFGVIATRSIYGIRDIRGLELAIVRKDETESQG